MLEIWFHTYLDPLCLALWFMDDGGKGGNTPLGLVLDISGFQNYEQLIIQHTFLEKFDIETSFHCSGNSVKLYFRRSTVYIFVELIAPFIIPSMMYKLSAFVDNPLSAHWFQKCDVCGYDIIYKNLKKS